MKRSQDLETLRTTFDTVRKYVSETCLTSCSTSSPYHRRRRRRHVLPLAVSSSALALSLAVFKQLRSALISDTKLQRNSERAGERKREGKRTFVAEAVSHRGTNYLCSLGSMIALLVEIDS